MTKKKKQEHEPAPAPERVDEISALRDERDDLLSRLQRVSADYVNYQKRAQRDHDEARAFANAALIKDLLVVIDDMERALAAAWEDHGEDDPLYAGMQLVHNKAFETLTRYGVEPIEALGKLLDPQLHSAIAQEPSDEHEPNTILLERVRGYTLNGRVLRPASVVVSKLPTEPSDVEEA